MKISKKVFIAVSVLVMGMSSLHAQRPSGHPFDPEKRAEKQTAMMAEKLSLDEKQAEVVQEINLKYAEQQKAKREEMKAEREAARAARKQMRESQKAELQEVLTPEQFSQLEQLREERGSRGRKGKRGIFREMNPEKRASMRTSKMVEYLGLDEDQAKQLGLLNLDFAKKRDADRKAQKERHEEYKTALEELLTPEQMQQFEEMEKEGGKGRRGQRRKGDGRM